MAAEQEEPVVERIVSFVYKCLKRQKVTARLGHFGTFACISRFLVLCDDKEFVMQPVINPLFAGSALALCDFIRVVDRNVVDSAGMDVEMLSKIFHAHRRAFDVPARVSASPRAFP